MPPSSHLAYLLLGLIVGGCGPTNPGGRSCRCVAELPSGAFDVPCGTSECVGGVGYRCQDDRAIALDPEACSAVDAAMVLDAARSADAAAPRDLARPCAPTTCRAAGKDCGAIDDGCGKKLDCGKCQGVGETCGGGGVPNVCGKGCVPTTCQAKGARCGSIGDGCGKVLDCGTCLAPSTCGGGGLANQCGCTPDPRACDNKNCGMVSDGCGRLISCGTCAPPQTCGALKPNLCGNGPCVPDNVAACQGKSCGTVANNCGQSTSCGTCTPPQACGGGGVANQCGCAPDNLAACANKQCGMATNNCGQMVSCGNCQAPATCVANLCACQPRTCAGAGAGCGPLTDGCGKMLDCGACAAPLVCGGAGLANQCGLRRPLVPGRVCSADNWCWERPLPQGGGIEAWWAITKTDVWAVGRGGLILHFDGAAWAGLTGRAYYKGVFAAVPGDLWVVGYDVAANGTINDDIVLRGDGTSWSRVALTTGGSAQGMHAVWGSAPGDIWVGSGVGTVYRFNNGKWTSMVVDPGKNAISAFWGTGPNNLYAAASSHGVFHWDGVAWTQETKSNINGLWGSSATDVWASGAGGVYHRLNGQWILAAGLPNAGFRGVFGQAANDVWAVGYTPGIHHFDGVTWKKASAFSANSIHGAPGLDAFAAMSGNGAQILRLGGGVWTQVGGQPYADAQNNLPTTLQSVHGTGANDVWAVGQFRDNRGGYALHWDGAAWSDRSLAQPGVWGFFHVHARAADDVWALSKGPLAANGDLYRWRGQGWSRTTAGNAVARAVWAAGANQAWAVGEDGKVLAWNGMQWTPQANPLAGTTLDYYAISGSDGANVWAVGQKGTVARWDGAAWNLVPTNLAVDLWGVYCAGPQDVWASTVDGALLHWDGAAWSRRPLAARLGTLHGAGPKDVWVVEDGAARVWHYDGIDWRAQDSITASGWPFGNLYAAGPTAVWMVGYSDLWSGEFIVRLRP